MKKIYFKGYYGYRNLGDDIFTLTAEWICLNFWKDYRPIFIGSDLPLLSADSRQYRIKNQTLRKIFEIGLCIYVDCIIYFGGSLFSKGSHNIKDIKYYIRKLPLFYNKTGTIGTSIGPFKEIKDYKSTTELLNKMHFTSVRDYSSIEELKKMGVNKNSGFSFDNAILIKDVFPELKSTRTNNGKLKIAISLCHYERYGNQNIENEVKRENAIKDFLEEFLQRNNKIEEFKFIVFNGNEKTGDYDVTHEFEKHFKTKVKTTIVNYSPDTKSMIQEIVDCDAMFGVRLHSGIVAYALDMPFMLVEYHKKCTEFLNTINHNFRFNIEDNENNIKFFETMLDLKKVPEIKESKFFKEIMKNQLIEIKKYLQFL